MAVPAEPPRPDPLPVLPADAVEVAAALLADGGLVGLPTETVYGLSARADDAQAVARVFAAKGRPADHPVIVHVASVAALDEAEGWARDVPAYARALVDALWPGPLTVIVGRGPRSGYHVTGGQETVGVRCPDHPVALAVLGALGRRTGRSAGLAAPSANRFGRVSPTTAVDVVADLGAHLDAARDAVLDGGPCRVGVESTIVACLGPAPVILRPGEVDAATVARVTGLEVRDADGSVVTPDAAEGSAAGDPNSSGGSGGPGAGGEVAHGEVRAPGTLASHYAPRARVVLVGAEDVPSAVADALREGRVGLVAASAVPTPDGAVRLSRPGDAREYARTLYAAFRAADALDLPTIIAVLPPPSGIGAAIRDRLQRARSLR